jgi:hypothetical protein
MQPAVVLLHWLPKPALGAFVWLPGLALAHTPVPPLPGDLHTRIAHPPLHRLPSGVQGDAPSPPRPPFSTGAEKKILAGCQGLWMLPGLSVAPAPLRWSSGRSWSKLKGMRRSPPGLREILVGAQGNAPLSLHS